MGNPRCAKNKSKKKSDSAKHD